MSAYTDLFDSDYATEPAALFGYSNYALFKQAVVALHTEAALVLADGSSTAPMLAKAALIADSAISYARLMLGGFLADPTVQANTASATDAQMQAAAHWLLPIMPIAVGVA